MDIKIISYFYHHLIIAFQTCKTYKVRAIKGKTQIKDETFKFRMKHGLQSQTRTQG
jgi:hypothetical protein